MGCRLQPAAGGAEARSLSGTQYGIQHPGEGGLEVLAAARVQPRGSLLALPDHAGLAQDLEVVRAGGLGDRHVEAGARLLGLRGQRGDHLESHGIAEGMKHRAQLELVKGGVWDLFLYDGHRTYDKVRQSSYNV